MAAHEAFYAGRTMQALEVLAFRASSAPQLAEALRIDARTARRLLNRLVDEGWLVRSEGRTRIYTLSLRVVALASHFAERAPLARAAEPAVAALHAATGATSYLAVPSYRATLCLVQRGRCADARPRLRELVPAHATAAGKALLAHRDAWRESVLELPLERLTERTVVDPARLRADAAAVRERGLATEHGEYRPGLHGLAAPVETADGDVPAAVALSGPGDLRPHEGDLRAAARRIAAAL